MKAKILIIMISLLVVSIMIFSSPSNDVDFVPVTMEDLNQDFLEVINQIEEQNIYFITKGKTIILYSNMGKSGLYTYPYAEIKQEDNKLIVNVKSHMAASDEYVKEILIASLKIKRLPKEIETTFLGEKTNYEIINLD